MKFSRPRTLQLAALALALTFLTLPNSSAIGTTPPDSAPRSTALPAAEPAAEPDAEPDAAAVAPERPNVLLITTDDQTLQDMAYMPKTRKLLGAAGVTFKDMISPHPLCCPARAELLTGQYAQNNGVRSNSDEWHGGYAYFNSRNTLATWLDDAGYNTAMVGKYLNQYHAGDAGPEHGWDIWNPTLKNVYGYYNYTMYNNGDPRRYTDVHNADLVANKTVDYINTFAGTDKPFFIWSSQVAPHGVCSQEQELDCQGAPPAAKRHTGMFTNARSPSWKDPAFNEDDVSDKSKTITKLPKVSAKHVNNLFRGRIRSLQAVDEGVAAAIEALQVTGELDNTLILFTSDNGYLLGEHRHITKNVPYEQALRVPLLVRGPGIPKGVVREKTVTLVDIAATISAAAGVRPGLTVDGRNVLPLAKSGQVDGHDTVLIQSGPRKDSEIKYGWAYRGVRTNRYTYVRWNADKFLELYDRKNDPAQLRNVAYNRSYAPVLADLAHRTSQLIDCAGAACRRSWPEVSKPR